MRSEALSALESALSAAVRASLPLPQEHRPVFLSRYLLAQLENSELPVAKGARQGKPAELQAELQALSDLLTTVVNSARTSAPAADWPIRAVANRLAAPPPPFLSKETVSEIEATEAKAKAKEMAAKAIATSAEEPAEPMPSILKSRSKTPSPMKVSFGSGEAPVPRRLAQWDSFMQGSMGDLTDSLGGLTMLSPEDFGIDAAAMDAAGENEDPFRISMRTGIIRRKSFKLAVPEESLAEAEDLIEKDFMAHVRSVAKLAFETYDKDNSGTIDKEELFLALLELGRVAPATAGTQSQMDYLEANFRLADTNGDGEVDFDEFVSFYASTLKAVEQEEVARKAFTKYDVDESNSLEKHELFQALFELDLVPGMDLRQKREYLEEQFAAADSNGDGVVDFAEFVAFYVTMMDASKKSDDVKKRRQRAERQRLDRLKRQAAYIDADAIMTACKSDEVVLVRGKWLLERAGYKATEKERKGRKVYTWSLPPAKAEESPPPLPCRQQLQREAPEALISAAELEGYHKTFLENLDKMTPPGGGPKRWEGVHGLPVVLASHCWATAEHPDPNGLTLRKLAAALASNLPTYQQWGFDDVGVFIDWCSLYQETPTEKRTPKELTMFHRAKNQMCVWFAHQQTTVYLCTASGTQPPEAVPNRGWPFFEEAACRLFKPRTPDRPFKLPHGALAPAWQKVVDTSATDRSDEKKRLPPLSSPQFAKIVNKGEMTDALSRAPPKDFSDPLDARVVARLYRRTIEDGFDGLDKLSYARLEWGDDAMATFAATLSEVACSHVVDLDLSYNDFSAKGMEALAHAISLGALSSVRTLNLSHCTALRELPEAIGKELHELATLNLEGCVGLKSLPKSLSTSACLRQLYVNCCHGLDEAMFKALPATVEVIKTPYVPPPVAGTPAATPVGTPRQ